MSRPSLHERLSVFAALESPPQPDQLAKEAADSIRNYPLSSLFAASHHDREGKVLHRSERAGFGDGQGVDVLEKRGWDDLPERVIVVSYSVSRSLRTAAIWRSSNSLKRRPRHRSAARTRAPNISLSTAFSPKPLGMIFSRRRSSTNRRSRRFVVRVARRCVTGKRRWAMHASRSSSKQAIALGRTVA